MITKAIIEKVLSNYKVKIRIPVINQIKTAPNATATDDLYSSIVCTIPSISIPLEVGDVVIVGFEDNSFKKPIILGYLYREEAISKHVDFNLSNLIVDGTTNLSKSTYIGDITPTEISYLAGINTNIQSQLNTLASRISLLEQAIVTPPENDDNTEEVTPESKPDPEPGTEPSEPGPEEPTEPPVEDDFVDLEEYEKYRRYVDELGLYEGTYTDDTFYNSPVYNEVNPEKFHLSSFYKLDNPSRPNHNGVDCLNPWGTGVDYKSLTAPARSKVVFNGTQVDSSGNPTGYGNYIILLHGKNYATLYAHLDEGSITMCSVGDIINKGDVFAKQGYTPYSDSKNEHLHLEVHKNYVSTSNWGTVLEPYAVLLGDWQLPDYEGEI